MFVCRVFQSAVLDLYIKSVLMSKTKPQQHILDRSSSFLRHVSHSEFKDLLLPTLQKTMLRSPENAMQSESSPTKNMCLTCLVPHKRPYYRLCL